MKHHLYNTDFKFVKTPCEFNKHTNKNLLQYCLGATLYMPGTKNFTQSILTKKILGLTSMVMCFEDAIAKESLSEAESNVLKVLEDISEAIDKNIITIDDIPLIFLRVRNTQQFIDFSKRLNKKQVKVLTGFVFPKFDSSNGYLYLNQLELLNKSYGEILYGMPILESKELILKESRYTELLKIQTLLRPFRNIILNVRVGATDLSSWFGVRRGMNYTVYDILPVRDCLSDVLNFLNRVGDDYIISAPVWEYFLASKKMKFQDTLESSIHHSLIKRQPIINEAVDGLLREVILDKANGFIGKTVIHPSHIPYVNAMQAVTKEAYEDALQILDTSGGVIKSSKSNKMNEIKPHRYWAEKIALKAKAYGVIESEDDYIKLFS
ncbi:HpcH/HpaI aldolase/citrate lyase family protein [uncultured Draconibacterium sp.]|uniref:HpcH/HpaI aldolase/citrate lyase family protein n=1 Tax=uncultured Draconibacterium sp. TaxID=1573823 RepID=UPI0029C6D009|nr:HpcH/HpaI aldolase/citrate lyase family protein [uncultured Draconibacterium sp.]